MTVIAEGRECVQGVDISRWQGKPDYSAFNLDFAYIKASGGDAAQPYEDSEFRRNSLWPKPWGAYHFASNMARPAPTEALFFCQVIRGTGWTLPPALDWEVASGLNEWDCLTWVLTFCQTVEAELGVKPIIYTGSYVTLHRGAALLAYDLWYAGYVAHPLPCPPWPTWSLWQYGSTGTAVGIQGAVDSDYADKAWFDRVLSRSGVTTTVTPSTPEAPTPTLEALMASPYLFSVDDGAGNYPNLYWCDDAGTVHRVTGLDDLAFLEDVGVVAKHPLAPPEEGYAKITGDLVATARFRGAT